MTLSGNPLVGYAKPFVEHLDDLRKTALWVAGFVALGMLIAMNVGNAQEKPALERGKDFIEVPAIADGLCVNNLFQSGMVMGAFHLCGDSG